MTRGDPAATAGRPLVRSVHRAGSGSLRVTMFYPADPEAVAGARLTGVVDPAPGERLPAVVFLPGINVVPDSYRWLAVRLAGSGCAVAVCSVIADLGPVGEGISPGIDLAMLGPDTLGSGPSAHALAEVLDLIAADPLLGGRADTDRVVLGGHSAGGTAALLNARPEWFPGVRAAFAYAGHTMRAARLGDGAAGIMPVSSDVPLLLVAGAQDGVIAASRDRYVPPEPPASRQSERTSSSASSRDRYLPSEPPGSGGHCTHDPVRRTFEEATSASRGDCWWVELADGAHFTACCPVDHTSGRSFLDPVDPPRQDQARELLSAAVLAFVAEHAAGKPCTLEEVVTRPGVSAWARR